MRKRVYVYMHKRIRRGNAALWQKNVSIQYVSGVYPLDLYKQRPWSGVKYFWILRVTLVFRRSMYLLVCLMVQRDLYTYYKNPRTLRGDIS